VKLAGRSIIEIPCEYTSCRISHNVFGNRLASGSLHATRTLTVRRAIQRQTWQRGYAPNEPCGRKRGANCPRRHGAV
jgi:hypothetical protein